MGNRAEAESWGSGTLGRGKQKELRAKGSKLKGSLRLLEERFA